MDGAKIPIQQLLLYWSWRTEFQHSLWLVIVSGLNKVPERFYSLDVLRGVAALAVAVYHWPHFFSHVEKYRTGAFDVTRLPYFEWLSILYLGGERAVDLFFCLSGFVFYFLYSRRVAEATISPGTFALLRFSRLYPLHFVTLLFFVLSQIVLPDTTFFPYPIDSSFLFLLNLFLVSAWTWGLGRAPSFNGPIWSVSVETLLYTLFFISCRVFTVRAAFLAIVSAAGFIVQMKFSSQIGRGVGSFFLGGCVFLGYQAIIASYRVTATTRWIVCLSVGAWAITALVFLHGLGPTTLSPSSALVPSRLGSIFQFVTASVFMLWAEIVLFPLTILSLALIETRRGTLGRRASFLGDISYSVYLLHYPLQIILAMVVARFTVGDSIFYTPWFMGLFMAVLTAIGLCSFRYFEMPAQRLIRQTGSLTHLSDAPKFNAETPLKATP